MTVFRWRKKGLLKPHHMGGKVYFLKAEVLRTIQSNPGNPEK
jgi:hypothetical protein